MHDEFMEITEEQRKRAEANRLAALEKRKAALESAKQSDPWKLFKCRKVSRESTSAATAIHPPKPQNASNDAFLKPHLTEKFRVRLEICSPDSFSITPKAVHGFAYPGEAECLQRLNDCLANGIEFEEIPWGTFNVVERLSHSFVLEQWMPCRPEHLSDDKVDELIGMLPKRLLDALLPFQLDGVRFGLRRGGRCLIADEMGLGKTLQECCDINEVTKFKLSEMVLVSFPVAVHLSSDEEGSLWVTSVYGPNNSILRKELWVELQDLFVLTYLKWCVGGDFNFIRNLEKMGVSRVIIGGKRDLEDLLLKEEVQWRQKSKVNGSKKEIATLSSLIEWPMGGEKGNS
ncbi:DNA annealing helicase and endonuclease ZRANB3 [Vitis vinifera]|uniref:DNA annealing helicase and endonuclease ZRANB3 n=1 Tax=Vitis vinifera TaxID=29760 RepID=A0A438HG63_VITVI|nr:DNA annealing helicase and endonuclease ZRANB3 [Vitis vinifera]